MEMGKSYACLGDLTQKQAQIVTKVTAKYSNLTLQLVSSL